MRGTHTQYTQTHTFFEYRKRAASKKFDLFCCAGATGRLRDNDYEEVFLKRRIITQKKSKKQCGRRNLSIFENNNNKPFSQMCVSVCVFCYFCFVSKIEFNRCRRRFAYYMRCSDCIIIMVIKYPCCVCPPCVASSLVPPIVCVIQCDDDTN